MMTEQDLRGASKKYDALPAHEKVAIDRQFDSMVKEVDQFNESKEAGLNQDLQALARDVGTHCYRQIVNGGYFAIPSRHGGNEFKGEPMSEEDKKIEQVVRKIVYDLTVEQSVEFLRGKIDLTKI